MKIQENACPKAFNFNKEDKPFIFISYSHQDEKKVFEKVRDIQFAGYRIWFDKGIETGSEWDTVIKQALIKSEQVIFFLSKAIFKSTYINLEMRLALELTNAESERKENFIRQIYLDDKEGINNCLTFLWKECEEITKYQGINYDEEIADLLLNPITNKTYYINQDIENLNLGYLPDDKEIECGKISLSDFEISEKTNKYVIHYNDNKCNNYLIDNVFQLTSQDSSAFDNFRKIDINGLKANDGISPLNLLSRQLDISISYVAPLKLLKGLITRLHENWPPMIKSYQNLAKKEGLIDDFHYFIEYCWLAWGPSVNTLKMSSSKMKHEFVLLQVAYGDESNSVPLVMSYDSWEKVKVLIKEGAPVGLKNLLIVNLSDDLFFKKRNVLNYIFPELESYKENGQDEEVIALFYPDNECENIKDLNFSGDYKWKAGEVVTTVSKPFYSTSYIWLILEEVEEEIFCNTIYERLKQPIKPGECIPFFEHANLSSEETLNFLHQCLVRKAIYHIINSKANFSSEKFYLLSTALFPEKIVQVFENEKSKLNDTDRCYVEKRLFVPRDDCMRSHYDVINFSESLSNEIFESLSVKIFH